MKIINIFLTLFVIFFIYSCDCYNYLTVNNMYEVVLRNDTYSFSEDDFNFIMKESNTRCLFSRNRVYIIDLYISAEVNTQKKILLKKDFLILTDSLENNYKAFLLRIDNEYYDSMILLPNRNYELNIIFDSKEKKEHLKLYLPLKMSFGYQTFESDSIKYFFKNQKFGIKYLEDLM